MICQMCLQSFEFAQNLILLFLEFFLSDGVGIIELIQQTQAFDLPVEIFKVLIVVLVDLRF